VASVEQKKQRCLRRKKRVRKTVFGTPQRPRLTVFRSLKNIYAQVIDDASGRTLVEASTRNKEQQQAIRNGGNIQAAASVGRLLAERAVASGISKVAFDRNGYKFHGRLKALADAAREGGLKF